MRQPHLSRALLTVVVGAIGACTSSGDGELIASDDPFRDADAGVEPGTDSGMDEVPDTDSHSDGGTAPDPAYGKFDRTGETITVGSIEELEEAVSGASPGDIVELEAGTYDGDTSLRDVSGEPNHPITIRGAGAEPAEYPVIDGGDEMGDHGSCMDVANVSWLAIENLRFDNCWDKAIVLENTQYITIDGIDVLSGKFPVLVTEGGTTHHTLIQNSHWKPAGREFWEDVKWRTIKKDDGSKWHTLMASSILDGESRGANVIRHNEVEYTFNAYRSRFSAKTLNTEIYGNHFHHIRDNAIEPEQHLFNFHVYHNTFDQVDPGMISVDSCRGGPMYLYGNVGHYDPSDPSRRYERVGKAGNIFKLVTVQDKYLSRPMYVFHNSFDGYFFGFKPNRYQKNIQHFNNAYNLNGGMWSGGWGDWLNEGNDFDYDASANGWEELEDYGNEDNGLENTSPQFRDAEGGDYRLASGSPLIDAGKIIDGFHRDYDGDAPDIGAFDGDERVKGPPFFIREPDDGLRYDEKPRVTAHDVKDSELTVYFSWPLDPSSIVREDTVLFEKGQSVDISSVELGGEGRRVTITAGRSLQRDVLDLCFESLPQGTNGQPVTYWGATLGCR